MRHGEQSVSLHVLPDRIEMISRRSETQPRDLRRRKQRPVLVVNRRFRVRWRPVRLDQPGLPFGNRRKRLEHCFLGKSISVEFGIGHGKPSSH